MHPVASHVTSGSYGHFALFSQSKVLHTTKFLPSHWMAFNTSGSWFQFTVIIGKSEVSVSN
jgi:hypothetical protein